MLGRTHTMVGRIPYWWVQPAHGGYKPHYGGYKLHSGLNNRCVGLCFIYFRFNYQYMLHSNRIMSRYVKHHALRSERYYVVVGTYKCAFAPNMHVMEFVSSQ